jgi:hypothetical protein
VPIYDEYRIDCITGGAGRRKTVPGNSSAKADDRPKANSPEFIRRLRLLADLADAKLSIPNPPAAAHLQKVLQLPAIFITPRPRWRIWRQNQSHTCSIAARPQKKTICQNTSTSSISSST